MKFYIRFIGFLAALSVLCGVLLSRASLVGRVGISLFYKQYRFLKTWWQGALTVFAVLLVLFLLQYWATRKLQRRKANALHACLIILAAAGLYFTYYDFRHTLSHRWLGERFHLGAYLFWLGWMAISFFFIFKKNTVLLNYEEERRNIDVSPHQQ